MINDRSWKMFIMILMMRRQLTSRYRTLPVTLPITRDDVADVAVVAVDDDDVDDNGDTVTR